jgi:hypothetical protein
VRNLRTMASVNLRSSVRFRPVRWRYARSLAGDSRRDRPEKFAHAGCRKAGVQMSPGAEWFAPMSFGLDYAPLVRSVLANLGLQPQYVLPTIRSEGGFHTASLDGRAVTARNGGAVLPSPVNPCQRGRPHQRISFFVQNAGLGGSNVQQYRQYASCISCGKGAPSEPH